MKPEWREITRGDVRTQAAGLYASLNPKGHLVINRATHLRMGAPDAVHLLYDAVNNRIGLKPTSRALRNAYPLTVHGNRRARRMVSVLKLMREVGIVISETVTFPTLEIDTDGILIIDLRAARVSKHALGRNRYLQNRRAKSELNT